MWSTARRAIPQPWFADARVPMLLAHQGGEKEWPSNTMYAFRKAHEVGSDVLDMDLQMTGDGVLVLIHDTTVDRTTDGHGAIREQNWPDLEILDAAYHFTLDGSTYPLRGQGIRIARLDEVLTSFPDALIQIEVKEAPFEIADTLAQTLKTHEAEKRVLLSCFREDMMAELRRACPTVASSATPKEIRNFVLVSWLHLEGLISPDYCALQIPLERHGLTLVSKRTVEAAHSRGVKVLPWTIDTPEGVDVCRQAGVDGFNTNWPSKMEAVRSTW
jgi:glycerophosphoryl diester phosphodiesterase